MNALLLMIVLGVVPLALALDLAAVLGWLRSGWTRVGHDSAAAVRSGRPRQEPASALGQSATRETVALANHQRRVRAGADHLHRRQ